jgi:hypothetical protein
MGDLCGGDVEEEDGKGDLDSEDTLGLMKFWLAEGKLVLTPPSTVVVSLALPG